MSTRNFSYRKITNCISITKNIPCLAWGDVFAPFLTVGDGSLQIFHLKEFPEIAKTSRPSSIARLQVIKLPEWSRKCAFCHNHCSDRDPMWWFLSLRRAYGLCPQSHYSRSDMPSHIKSLQSWLLCIQKDIQPVPTTPILSCHHFVYWHNELSHQFLSKVPLTITKSFPKFNNLLSEQPFSHGKSQLNNCKLLWPEVKYPKISWKEHRRIVNL